MKVIPTEEIPWKTVVATARVSDVQNKHVREGEFLPGVGYAADCYNYVGAPYRAAIKDPGQGVAISNVRRRSASFVLHHAPQGSSEFPDDRAHHRAQPIRNFRSSPPCTRTGRLDGRFAPPRGGSCPPQPGE